MAFSFRFSSGKVHLCLAAFFILVAITTSAIGQTLPQPSTDQRRPQKTHGEKTIPPEQSNSEPGNVLVQLNGALIKLRASQINGCAYCLDMHWKDLKSIGEQDHRLYELDAWEETSYYTERECAASLDRRRDEGR